MLSPKKYSIYLLLLSCLLNACTVFSPARSSNYKANSVIKECESYLGTPYKFGGTTKKGIDCSGLVYNAFKELGHTMPRVSYQQAEVFDAISIDRLAKGDLVYFSVESNRINHTGVITKINGAKEVYFIHASVKGGVREDNLYSNYWYSKFVKATRPRF